MSITRLSTVRIGEMDDLSAFDDMRERDEVEQIADLTEQNASNSLDARRSIEVSEREKEEGAAVMTDLGELEMAMLICVAEFSKGGFWPEEEEDIDALRDAVCKLSVSVGDSEREQQHVRDDWEEWAEEAKGMAARRRRLRGSDKKIPPGSLGITPTE